MAIKRAAVYLITSVCACLVLSDTTHNPRSKFKAAVYEHKVILPEKSDKPVTRQAALSLMYKNLDVYRTQTEAAGQQNVDILVFPEDGTYGMMIKNRTHLSPYLEYIPDPLQETWNPCTEPGMHTDTEVQHRLSCLARNGALYLVANMGDKQPCSTKTDPDCPSDGQYQFNTNVVYDPNGTLIARYHKEHLFFETQFNKPKKVNIVHFDTPFGRFGVFTCFDILFRDPPITLVERYGIGNVVFPTAWMDALPLLAAIQFHSSFAVKMRVNFLAANIHLPAKRFQGSGIYTPDVNANFYYNNSELSDGRLLISELDVVHKTTPRVKEALPIVNEAPPIVNILPVDQISHQTTNGEEFKAEVFHDLFNFVLVEETKGSLSVCYNKLCCHLDYEKDNSSSSNNDMYAFGAFDNLHTYEGQYYLQICTLLRCANSSKESCGSSIQQAQTRFRYLRVKGTFGTPYVFPAILLTDSGQLKLAPKQWTFNDLVLESTEPLNFPLLSANLFGRIYDWDEDEDSNSSGCCHGDWRLMLMLLTVYCTLKIALCA
ncbi:pantetheinase-like [Gigantopelta aegis]|uniref:pantetheinase-like n=1 Tax=Gigantopelta aegis TaxID=1735272 RepID=UPI001B887C09|nr:pantetheinase-like [Gigantopelta aegis]